LPKWNEQTSVLNWAEKKTGVRAETSFSEFQEANRDANASDTRAHLLADSIRRRLYSEVKLQDPAANLSATGLIDASGRPNDTEPCL